MRSELLAYLRADGARVDPHLRRGQPGVDPVWRRGNLFEYGVARKGGEEDVGPLCHLSWCVAPLQPLLDLVLNMLAALRFAVYQVSSGEEACRHVPAHVTEADETHLGSC